MKKTLLILFVLVISFGIGAFILDKFYHHDHEDYGDSSHQVYDVQQGLIFPKENLKQVVGSFYPYVSLVESMLPESVKIEQLLRQGVDPHGYEPSPQDVQKLLSSDLIVFNGLGLDEWVDQLQSDLSAAEVNLFSAQYAALQNQELIPLKEEDLQDQHHDDHQDHHENHHGHTHHGEDPHIWLSPRQLLLIGQELSSQLQSIYPKQATEIERISTKFLQDLEKLHLRYQEKLSRCAQDTVVMPHQVLGYIAQDYGFKTLALQGYSPDAQASIKDVQETLQFIDDYQLKAVVNDFTQDQALNLIAEEKGIKILTFNTMEQFQPEQQTTLLQVLESNLQTLVTALECE